MAIAGAAACNILSSEAYVYVETANVSKLKGLSIRVAGNSFTTSDITSKTEVNKAVFISGECTLINIRQPDIPSNLDDSSIELLILW